MKKLILVAHNVRSAQNVGAIFRSAACFGVAGLVLSGYTPYPKLKKDSRLPHEIEKITKAIAKTALGAEKMVRYSHVDDLMQYLAQQKQAGWLVAALEQHVDSKPIKTFRVDQPTILIVGNEVDGLDDAVLKMSDVVLEIPMHGPKESLNVAVATGVALYELTR